MFSQRDASSITRCQHYLNFLTVGRYMLYMTPEKKIVDAMIPIQQSLELSIIDCSVAGGRCGYPPAVLAL